jgi:protein subunit release factor A
MPMIEASDFEVKAFCPDDPAHAPLNVQHAVLVLHKPTGKSVVCAEHTDQQQNYQAAYAQLVADLEAEGYTLVKLTDSL